MRDCIASELEGRSMSREFQGRAFDSGFAALVPQQRQQHEPTPEERAKSAEQIATNLEQAHASVVESLEAIAHAHHARDVAAYANARASADRAVERVRMLAETARAHAVDAPDLDVRAKLEQAPALAAVAAQNLAAVPAAPEPVAPALRDENALLAALPPVRTDGPSKAVFEAALHGTRAALVQMPFSDIVAVEKILAEFPSHEIAVRFRRFKVETQRSLRALLTDAKIRVRARSREASMAKLAVPPPAFAAAFSPVLLAPPPAFQPDAAAEPAVAPAANHGAAQPLPDGIRTELEVATGRTLLGVRVHVGEQGEAVADSHGARAVAIGQDIYFGDDHYDPTSGRGRELIAHEVAHTVQAQVSGTTKPAAKSADPDGQPSIESAERNADALATQVGHGGGPSSSWTPTPVSAGASMKAPEVISAAPERERAQWLADWRKQRETRDDDAASYASFNFLELRAAIVARCRAIEAPEHAGVHWLVPVLGERVGEAFDRAVGEADFSEAIKSFLHPADLSFLIDRHRPLTKGTAGQPIDGVAPAGPLRWRAEVGVAIAVEAELRLHESLARMVPRYAAQVEAKHPVPVAKDDLVTSHPMDRVAVQLLCDERILKATPPARTTTVKKPHTSTADDRGAGFRDGVEFLQDWRWLGEVDGSMWNWVEVKAPRHATAEDVAATLYFDVKESQRAYAIVASPPYFRIPENWADEFGGAKAYKPAKKATNQPGSLSTANDGALALASSALATEAAISQAAPERKFDPRGIPVPPNFEKLNVVLDRSHRQLVRARELLGDTELWPLLLPAISFIDKHREHLLELPEDRLIALTPVVDGQQAILFDAVGSIAMLTPLLKDDLAKDNAAAGRAGAKDPGGFITAVLRRYATVCGESHLLAPAREQLAQAHTAHANLSLQQMEQSSLDTRNNLAALSNSRNSMMVGVEVAASHVAALEQQIAEMRAGYGAGRVVNPDDALLVKAELKEEAVLTRGRSIVLQLESFAELGTAGIAAEIYPVATELKFRILYHYRSLKAEKVGGIDPCFKRQIAEGTEAAADATDAAITAFLATQNLYVRLHEWAEAIESHEKKMRAFEIVSTILILVGTSMVGSFVGGAVTSAVRGTLLADAATATIGMSWGARAATATGWAAGLATDAAINAGVQVWQSGGSFGDSFADNMLTNAVTRVALAPLHAALNAWDGAAALKEVENLSLWERSLVRGRSVLKTTVQLTAEMMTGIGVSYVEDRWKHGDRPQDEPTAAQWLIQGASMGIGHFLGKWTQDFQGRVEGLVERGAHLRRRAANMKARAWEVERSGSADQAMELLVERHALLVEEEKVVREMAGSGKLSAQTATTMLHGNSADRGEIAGSAMKTMPLRLNHLQPDDTSNKTWAGTTEDIAIALHQAATSGIEVEVLSHDTAAREWKIRLGGEELKIVETKLEGQPRTAKPHPTDADRQHAMRYAASAGFMQEKWLGMNKAQIDARPVIEFDYLQLGAAYAGVINQSTLPAGGTSQIVVYDHAGTLSKRGPQELGQAPEKFEAAGVRTTEQAPPGTEWIQSDQLDRALTVGRAEMQTPAYQGTVVGLEPRPAGALATEGAHAWKAPNRKFRVKVRDATGAERWFYVDRFDNTGGLGPGSVKAAKDAAGDHLEPMLASGQVLRADDPDYTKKLRGGRTLVWGGSPSGAWAAEPAALPHGAEVTIVGDTRPAADWPTLLREYEDINYEIAHRSGNDVPEDLVTRKHAIEKQIAEAHSATTIRRNRKPGAPYEKAPTAKRAKGEVQIEFGTPTKIEPMEDGRVRVTIGGGENAQTSVYDQVVVAHGQDPGAAGAPGGLLGNGARGDAEVPAGTIALRPIYAEGNKTAGRPVQIVGLESIDPPGIRLMGAAYASPRMAPWVDKLYREQFTREVKSMSDETAVTRDHGKVSADSRAVSAGVEVQRDQIPRGNEVLGAKSRYRLPDANHSLALDPQNEAVWDEQVRDYFSDRFSKDLRADPKWVRVERRGGGKSKALVYEVFIDGNDAGTYKVFGGTNEAESEQKVLKELEAKHLKHMTPVGERGVMKVSPDSGYGSSLLMDSVPGESVKAMVEHVGASLDATARAKAFAKVMQATRQVATGLAEMHQKFEAGGLMTKEAKLDDATYFINTNFRSGSGEAKVKTILGERDFVRVKAQIEGPLLQAFLVAQVPATAYHGDANAGNFILDEYQPSSDVNRADKGEFKKLGVIDAGSMQWSLDAPKSAGDGARKGNKTGAADTARFLGSLETLTPGALTSNEISQVREIFEEAYFAEYNRHYRIDRRSYADAEKWYRIEMEVAVMKGDPAAKARLLELLDLSEGHP